MARTVLTVDGITLLDADLNLGQQIQPPELDALTKPAEPKPWTIYVNSAIAESLLRNKPTEITVTTHPNGWAWTIHTH